MPFLIIHASDVRPQIQLLYHVQINFNKDLRNDLILITFCLKICPKLANSDLLAILSFKSKCSNSKTRFRSVYSEARLEDILNFSKCVLVGTLAGVFNFEITCPGQCQKVRVLRN